MIPIGMAGQHKLAGAEPVPITAEEIPAFAAAVDGAFHGDVTPDEIEHIRSKLEPERTLVVRDAGKIVAGASIYSRTMTVPGGEAPVAGVTQVGVMPTHRRRGLLTAMMRRQLDDVRDAGREAFAALWAAEAGIYGRFGYGLASVVADVDVTRHKARLRSAPKAQVDLLTPPDAIDAMRPIYDAVRPTRPGMLDRGGPWWKVRISDPESRRGGAGALRAAVIDGAAYALYAVNARFEEAVPAGEVFIREVMAVDPDGYAAIWEFLLGLDLVRRLNYGLAPSDDALAHLLTEAQAVTPRIDDSLWIRLVDLPRALRERTYAQPFEVVFDVEDDFCPWNAGRWALRWDGKTATCAQTSLPAALQLSAVELGAAYLGGTTLEVLARAGRVRELRDGALLAASRGFRADVAPYCPEIF
jgi:predicted acetyltransferase